MKTIKISVIMSIALLLSVGLFAQRGRGYNNSRGYNNNQYRHYNQYNQNRNQFSVTIGPRYNYRPNYRLLPATGPYTGRFTEVRELMFIMAHLLASAYMYCRLDTASLM